MAHSILIVDDLDMARNEISKHFEALETTDSIFTANDGREALLLLKKHPKIDLMILDIKMKGMGGIELAKELKRRKHPVKIIATTAHAELCYVKPMFQEGVMVILSKNDTLRDLPTAIDAVFTGRQYHSQELEEVVQMILKNDTQPATRPSLKPRELQLLPYICNGFTEQEVADLHYISKFTVKSHKEHIFNAFNELLDPSRKIRNTIMLANQAREWGFDLTIPQLR